MASSAHGIVVVGRGPGPGLMPLTARSPAPSRQRPPTTLPPELEWKLGDIVEVESEDDGFQACWCEAQVITTLITAPLRANNRLRLSESPGGRPV